ncbi:MAG: thiamine phosphate synthase [Candidatus Scalindua sp.]|jgi:thiamine-phosphate pyrophosphorylase|nr:thiamine phosphate synthase [Candidatus Scalindua sp.]MDV5165695.1 thiamine phosphate synthase [Candidatus Scalindua sp.]
MGDSIRGLDFVLITDRKVCGNKLTDIIEQAIDGGVGTVQLREKDLSTCDLYRLAKEVREITSRKGANLIINDRVDIATAVDADGVHLGWQSLEIDTVRRMIGHDKIIGFSAHSLEEAERAENSGADYISISPIFDTANKDYSIKPLGVGEIGKIKGHIDIPVIALGGINENNVNKVLKNGADGIAVMSAILLSDSPGQTVTRICGEMRKIGSESEIKL